MNKVRNVFVFDKNEEPILKYNNGEIKKEFEIDYITKIISSLKKLAKDFNENLRELVIGDLKYFYTVDKISGTRFIIETSKDVSDHSIRPILKEIKNLYINEFIGDTLMNSEQYENAKNRYIEKLRDYLKSSIMGIEDFLASI